MGYGKVEKIIVSIKTRMEVKSRREDDESELYGIKKYDRCNNKKNMICIAF